MTLHYEETESEVKVETMNDEPERIKCFPLYTILLALNRTQLDLLSLGCQGQELEILQTSKFNFIRLICLMKALFLVIEEFDSNIMDRFWDLRRQFLKHTLYGFDQKPSTSLIYL